MERKIIQRGAEAILYRDGSEVVKDRVVKGYRLPELDGRIRRLRTRGEARLLDYAARSGLDVPRVASVEGNVLRMEFISGSRVKDVLNGMPENEQKEVCSLIGEALAKMHSAGMAHGDFTTSNMILTGGGFGEKSTTTASGRKLVTNNFDVGSALPSKAPQKEETLKLFVIDFGLAKMSKKAEDHATDIYLLYEALKAAHFKYLNRLWQYILQSYSGNYVGAGAVLQRFGVIEKRRRYKGE
jgi:tRNA A-37 threonylcarbamoyl transferase component Bud32